MSADLTSRILSAALDVLLPGDGTFPAASAVALAERLAEYPALARPARAAVATLDEAFLDGDDAQRLAAMTALEQADPTLFGQLVTSAYTGYYSSTAVLEALSKTSFYEARPPQPEGHALPPFDPALLAVPAARPPSYRIVPERGSTVLKEV